MLQGAWTMESFVIDGETVPVDQVRTGRLSVEGPEYRASLGASSVLSRIRVDPSKEPGEVDFAIVDGPQVGKTVRGIYKVEGDRLVVCRGVRPESGRPVRFEAPADSGMLLVAWNRTPDEKDDATAREIEAFQGEWRLISVLSDGKYTPEDKLGDVRVIIKGSAHSVRFGDQFLHRDMPFTINPSARPKRTTDTIHEGPQKGKQIHGIYRLEGDTLVSCVAGIDKEAPKAFTAEPGSGHIVRVFRRVKNLDPASQKAIEAELKKFEGTWRFESMKVDGKALPPDDPTGQNRMVIKGDRFTTGGGPGAGTMRGVFEVDPTANPKTIDVIFAEGPTAGRAIHGVYELDGDTYRISSGTPGKPRPKSFTGTPGSGIIEQTLKRVKP
ncbi:MAG: TIGR03067 domain-containing protein [Isosphaeraceae bacterium]